MTEISFPTDWLLSHYLASSNAKQMKINNGLAQFYITLFFCNLSVRHILPLQFHNNVQQVQNGSVLGWGNVEKLVSVSLCFAVALCNAVIT